MLYFTGNGLCAYPADDVLQEQAEMFSFPQTDGPSDPRRYAGAAASSHLFGQPYNPPYNPPSRGGRSASVNPQPIYQSHHQSPHFHDQYSAHSKRHRQSSVAPFRTPRQQERSPFFPSIQPAPNSNLNHQHRHRSNQEDRSPYFPSTQPVANYFPDQQYHRRSSHFPFISASQPAWGSGHDVSSQLESQPTYNYAGTQNFGLLPWITAPIPLSDKEVTMISDFGADLREVMLAALSAAVDPRAREELENAVGSKTASDVVDFWTEEFAVE